MDQGILNNYLVINLARQIAINQHKDPGFNRREFIESQLVIVKEVLKILELGMDGFKMDNNLIAVRELQPDVKRYNEYLRYLTASLRDQDQD